MADSPEGLALVNGREKLARECAGQPGCRTSALMPLGEEFRLRSVAIAAFGPATLFGLAEGAMLPGPAPARCLAAYSFPVGRSAGARSSALRWMQ